MTPTKGTEHHFGPLWEKDFEAISGGPWFSRPLCFTAGYLEIAFMQSSPGVRFNSP